MLVTEWDTAADAAEFRAAAEDAVSGLAGGGSVVTAGRRVVIAHRRRGMRGGELGAILEALAAG